MANKTASTALTEDRHSLPHGQLLERILDGEYWTGKPPVSGVCPGVDGQGKIHSLTIPDLSNCTRKEVDDYFDNGWTLTEVLFSSLVNEEAFYRPPFHGLRHPLVFYYAHPATLYVNKLRIAGILGEPVNPYYEGLFETGVDEMSWDDMSKNTMEWPTLAHLRHYRQTVYKIVKNVIATHPGLANNHPVINQESPLWALFMGFEHERIHLETSSVLVRELPPELVTRPLSWPDYHPSIPSQAEVNYPPSPGKDYPDNPLIAVRSQSVEIGKALDTPTYGWDNEYGSRQQLVNEFSASRNLISNGEYWQFVAAGGYSKPEYWSTEGWQWRTFRNTKCPRFWNGEGPAGSNRFALRTCFDVVPMPWSWPVIVNHHEAAAYCRWRSERDNTNYRLPSEAEHHCLRQVSGIVGESNYSMDDLSFNLNLRCGAEYPVDFNINKVDEFADVFGNVWQWLEDHLNPLPGFRVHRYYDDFSTPCFDGKHHMIMGGSFVSTGDEASVWARFHFRPHFYQHAGFRLVSGEGNGGAVHIGTEADGGKQYESRSTLNEYLTLHFAPPEVQMPLKSVNIEFTQFPQRCADLITKWMDKLQLNAGRALDIGCAVGGSTFRLAERFSEVTGVDLSESFINSARQIQRDGKVQFHCKKEGDLSDFVEVDIDVLASKKVMFRQADACSLPPEFVDFDAVLLANVLCRLPSPMACISRLGGSRGIVRKGGIIAITTPFTWMEKYTPKDVWLGGFIDESGKERLSEEGLIKAMSPEFDLLEKFDMPLIIREHQRKYQLIAALATVWRRK